MSPSPEQHAWNAHVSASIGAALDEHRQQRPSLASWWLDVPRERWAAAVAAETPRMATSKMARTISSQVIAWKD